MRPSCGVRPFSSPRVLRFHLFTIWPIPLSYLYIVLSWHPYLGIDLAKWPAIKSFFEVCLFNS